MTTPQIRHLGIRVSFVIQIRDSSFLNLRASAPRRFKKYLPVELSPPPSRKTVVTRPPYLSPLFGTTCLPGKNALRPFIGAKPPAGRAFTDQDDSPTHILGSSFLTVAVA